MVLSVFAKEKQGASPGLQHRPASPQLRAYCAPEKQIGVGGIWSLKSCGHAAAINGSCRMSYPRAGL